jgi:hypothetical protein
MSPSLSLYDEGLILYGSLNVFHGQLPYKDFWSFYGPGEYYLLATLFHLFGVYAFLGRVVYVAMMLATSFAVIEISWLLGGRRSPGVIAAVTAIIWVAASTAYLYPPLSALCLGLLAVLCLVQHWRYGGKRWLCVTGVLIACEMFFRHDLAFYSFIVVLAGECFYYLVALRGSGGSKWKLLLVDAACLIGCIAAVATPGLVYLLRRIPLSDISYQLFYFPSHIYPVMRRLPFFTGGAHLRLLAHGIIFIPSVLAVSATLCIMNREWREQVQPWQTSGVVSVTVLALVMSVSGLIRSDSAHESPCAITCFLLLACMLPTISLAGRLGRAALVGSTICCLLVILPPLHVTALTMKNTVSRLLHPHRQGSLLSLCHPPAGLERATCLEVDPVEAQVVEYIQAHTAADDKVYSGVGRHDKLLVNDMLLYFLAKRDAPTRWYYLEPGLETTYPIQEQMIDDLDSHHAKYVVRNLTWDDISEPNGSRFSSGVTILDQYIDSNYSTVATFPQVLILRRVTPF